MWRISDFWKKLSLIAPTSKIAAGIPSYRKKDPFPTPGQWSKELNKKLGLGTAEFNMSDRYSKHRQLVSLDAPTDMVEPIYLGHSTQAIEPKIAESAFIAPNATIVGNVEVWDHSSVWYNVAIRGDSHSVQIGMYVNVQDGTIIAESPHRVGNDHDGSTIIGHYSTIGHSCYLQGCTLEEECYVGMGSILEVGSYMEKGSMLGAFSVLAANTRIPSGQLWLGNPARFVRELTDSELDFIKKSAVNYEVTAEKHKEEFYHPIPMEIVREAEKEGLIVTYDMRN